MKFDVPTYIQRIITRFSYRNLNLNLHIILSRTKLIKKILIADVDVSKSYSNIFYTYKNYYLTKSPGSNNLYT